MDVYADLYFLINFSMDYLCLWITARILRRPLPFRRGFCASVLGGLYAVGMLFPSFSFFFGLLLDTGCCYFLCLIAFFNRRENFKTYLRLSVIYFLISALLGGIMTVLYTQLNRIPRLLDRVEEDGISVWLFFLLAGFSALLSRLFGGIFAGQTGHRSVRLEITAGGSSAVLNGLWDSGNLLTDPLSGKPVIPVECSHLTGLLPKEVLYAAADQDPASALASLSPQTVRELHLRLLPVRTANGQSLQLGFIPESILLVDGESGERHPVCAVLCPLSLGIKGEENAPEALLPTTLFTLTKPRKGIK